MPFTPDLPRTSAPARNDRDEESRFAVEEEKCIAYFGFYCYFNSSGRQSDNDVKRFRYKLRPEDGSFCHHGCSHLRGPNSHNFGTTIGCDNCHRFFHTKCIGLHRLTHLIDTWTCPWCSLEGRGHSTLRAYTLVISKMRQHIENLEKNTLKIFCYKSKDRVRWPPKVGSTLADHFGELYHGYTYRGSSVQRDDVSIEVLTHESHAIFVTRGEDNTNSVVGALSWSIHDGSYDANDRIAYLGLIRVTPEFQDAKYGRLMLLALEQHAFHAGARTMCLWSVRDTEQDSSAYSFYLRCNYRPIAYPHKKVSYFGDAPTPPKPEDQLQLSAQAVLQLHEPRGRLIVVPMMKVFPQTSQQLLAEHFPKGTNLNQYAKLTTDLLQTTGNAEFPSV